MALFQIITLLKIGSYFSTTYIKCKALFYTHTHIYTHLCVSHSVVSDSLQPQQTPLSMEFSRQGYWSGLPLSPPIYINTHTHTHINLIIGPKSIFILQMGKLKLRDIK